jgi:hypothetical protein
MLESYLEKPYWVVDFLPKQVPENGGGRFFSVEQYYLEPTRYAILREHFSDILLKLYCYYDLRLFIGDDTLSKAIKTIYASSSVHQKPSLL